MSMRDMSTPYTEPVPTEVERPGLVEHDGVSRAPDHRSILICGPQYQFLYRTTVM